MSFRNRQIASAFSFLLLSVLASVLTPSPCCFGCPQTSAGPQTNAVSDDDAQINALIRDLRNPKFGVRESASQKLTEIGSAAVAALRLASESDSLEVRVRAEAILASILQSTDSSFGSSEQVTIKQFKNAGPATRVAILRKEAQTKNTSLFLHLLDIVVAEEANSEGTDVQTESAIEMLMSIETGSPLTQFISSSLIARNWSKRRKDSDASRYPEVLANAASQSSTAGG